MVLGLSIVIISLSLFTRCVCSVNNEQLSEDKETFSSSSPLSILLLASIYPGHFYPLLALGEELVLRGHNVTMVGPVLEGYEGLARDAEDKGIIFISTGFQPREAYDIVRKAGKHEGNSNFNLLSFMYNLTQQLNEDNVKKTPDYRLLVKLKDIMKLSSFDYVISDHVSIPAALYLLEDHHYGDRLMTIFCPLPIHPRGSTPWPYPKLLTPFTDNMSFTDRLLNTAIYGVIEWAALSFAFRFVSIVVDIQTDETMDAFLGVKYPVIYNTLVGFDWPRTTLPLQHYVGPLLTRSLPPLEDELLSWLNTKPINSVLYVSMGTSVDVTTYLANVILSLANTADTFILWSSRNDLSELTIDQERVYITQWISQTALLSHPSVKHSIMQCGITSVQESLYYGIPVICIPGAFEQYDIALRLVSQGLGAKLAPNDINEQTLKNALDYISSDTVISNVNRMSRIMKANRGTVRAADLVELYADVGHDHGIPSYVKYNWYWYQYYNIDVYLVLVVMVVIVVWIGRRVCRALLCRRCRGHSKEKKE